MKKEFARRAAVVFSLIMLGTVAYAQDNTIQRDDRPRIGFGPQVGLHSSQSSDNMRVMGGLAMRLRLAPALGIEGSINYREDEFLSGAITTKSWPIQVTGLIYPLPILYGAIGAGWYNTTIDYNVPTGPGVPLNLSSDTQQEFGWHFGGGLEIPAGPGSFVADIRYVFLNYDFQKFPGSNDVKSNFYVITAGYLFGL